jgi:hypothetical protein
LHRGRVDDLPRRETAGGRLGRTVQLQADEAAACFSFGSATRVSYVLLALQHQPSAAVALVAAGRQVGMQGGSVCSDHCDVLGDAALGRVLINL